MSPQYCRSYHKKITEKSTYVGAPFESDHHLASLFLKGVVDCIATIDSNLFALGTDVLTDVKFDRSCQLYKYNESLSKSLSNQIGRDRILGTTAFKPLCLILW